MFGGGAGFFVFGGPKAFFKNLHKNEEEAIVMPCSSLYKTLTVFNNPTTCQEYIDYGMPDGCAKLFKRIVGKYNIDLFKKFDEFGYFRNYNFDLNKVPSAAECDTIFIPEILLLILSFLPTDISLLNCMVVCRDWYDVVNSHFCWRERFLEMRRIEIFKEIKELEGKIVEQKKILTTPQDDTKYYDPRKYVPEKIAKFEREIRSLKLTWEKVKSSDVNPKWLHSIFSMSKWKYPTDYIDNGWLCNDQNYYCPWYLLRGLGGICNTQEQARQVVAHTELMETVILFLYGATGWFEQSAAVELFVSLTKHLEIESIQKWVFDERVMQMMCYLFKHPVEYYHRYNTNVLLFLLTFKRKQIQHHANHYGLEILTFGSGFGGGHMKERKLDSFFNKLYSSPALAFMNMFGSMDSLKFPLVKVLLEKYNFGDCFLYPDYDERCAAPMRRIVLSNILRDDLGRRFVAENFETVFNMCGLRRCMHFIDFVLVKEILKNPSTPLNEVFNGFSICMGSFEAYFDRDDEVARRFEKKLDSFYWECLCHVKSFREKFKSWGVFGTESFADMSRMIKEIEEKITKERTAANQEKEKLKKSAIALKDQGNAQYKLKLFDNAIDLYVQAVRRSPMGCKKLKSILLGNISECYVQLMKTYEACFFAYLSLMFNYKNFKSHFRMMSMSAKAGFGSVYSLSLMNTSLLMPDSDRIAKLIRERKVDEIPSAFGRKFAKCLLEDDMEKKRDYYRLYMKYGPREKRNIIGEWGNNNDFSEDDEKEYAYYPPVLPYIGYRHGDQ